MFSDFYEAVFKIGVVRDFKEYREDEIDKCAVGDGVIGDSDALSKLVSNKFKVRIWVLHDFAFAGTTPFDHERDYTVHMPMLDFRCDCLDKLQYALR